MSVFERVRALAKVTDLEAFSGKRHRLAARHLFSALSHLEQLAVLAAERGDGIPGQLEDELVHRDVFALAARELGGLAEASEEARELVSYVESLRGAVSLAVLNVTAEGWLANVFSHLAAAGFQPKLLEAIHEDEARHSSDALALARPAPEEAKGPLHELETLLARFAGSSGWFLPLYELIGPRACARMGLGGLAAHRRACAHLGVRPAGGARAIEVSCRQAVAADAEPRPVPMTGWQTSKQRLWQWPAPIYDGRWVTAPAHDVERVEILIGQAAGAALAARPSLRLTLRGQQLYRPISTVIGFRRLHDRHSRSIVTVYATDPQKRTPERLASELRRRTERLRSETYEPVPEVGELVELLPPPRCSVVVSQCAPWSVSEGFAALVPLEGVAALVVIGRERDGRIHLGLTADHRVWDAYEVGRFLDSVESHLGSGRT